MTSVSAATADNACKLCRIRKRPCNKNLPKCSSCAARGVVCDYDCSGLPRRDSRYRGTFIRHDANTLVNVKARILRHLQSESLTPERVCDLYFKGFHRFLPMLTPVGRQDWFRVGAGQESERAVLLLAMYLAVQTDTTAYDLLKSLLPGVQAAWGVNLRLIQTHVLLASHEYSTGRLTDAALSSATSRRMARIAGLDRAPDHITQAAIPTETEGWDTWCAISMLDSVILSELDVAPTAAFPNDHPSDTSAKLPYQLPSVNSVVTLDLEHPFPQQLRAAHLLTCVHAAVAAVADWESIQLLVDQLRRFLQEVLNTSDSTTDKLGPPITIAIRAFFVLHRFIWTTAIQDTALDASECKRFVEQAKISLTTATQFMLDAAASENHQRDIKMLHGLPLCCRANLEDARRCVSDLELGPVALWRLLELERRLSETFPLAPGVR